MPLTLAMALRTPLRATPARSTLTPLLRRHLSTPPPAPEASSSKSSSGPSATALFYRQLVPSMIACLSIGSIVYYALELTHSILDREVVVRELEEKVATLEGEVERLRVTGGASAAGSAEEKLFDGGKSWWKVW
ncbi:hypothetical protein BCR35DRAFT_301696 [Leucosporidium creatinivorum]|uniref:Uncharacterized protein n=1 Tax=Leucosporidium creatinivorum TaxID=106004 RepID=A0A1Y2FW14_9BASI|nr:hypothetical protein BCR35DRAFT_301696 [Leucosporidium creatinivorum]